MFRGMFISTDMLRCVEWKDIEVLEEEENWKWRVMVENEMKEVWGKHHEIPPRWKNGRTYLQTRLVTISWSSCEI